MIIAKIVGSIVSTVKHEAYTATKLMIVQPLGTDMKPEGDSFLALDTVGAGEGETVLVVKEGAAARQVLKRQLAPVRSLVIGIIDQVDMNH